MRITINRMVKALALVLIGVALGYFWHMQAVAYGVCMISTQPNGWVENNERIKAAMQRMGPMHSYAVDDQVLYVNRGDGEWLRLKY